MKLKHNKISIKTILTALIVLFTFAFPASYAKAATTTMTQDKVKLYYNDSAAGYYSSSTNYIYIKVANDIKNPSVYVRYKYSSYDWSNEYATFYKALDDNYSIFKAEVYGFGLIEYSINVHNGEESYINDNNGNYFTNYQVLGDANVVALRNRSSLGSSDYEIKAAVKNLGYHKDIKVRYTVDNWKTYKEAPLTYKSTNDNNDEIWSTTIDTTGAEYYNFQYAISYTVNGQTYWDNNFGLNYDSSHRDNR